MGWDLGAEATVRADALPITQSLAPSFDHSALERKIDIGERGTPVK